MRLESVTAVAFGPFQGETLALAPGMTLVHGPNEAGKSSWHAALYAGLCGTRRGRGSPRREEAAFAERHRPWEGARWEVVAAVQLEDGRRIELRHDLLGRVDCRATDLALGRDCSDEIVHEGSPDGSRWLGLDRRSFLATACVQQADLLAVTQDAALLQEHLQRAASGPGADATAARAIEQIERFRSERIGSDRVASARPLRQAMLAVERARAGAAEARASHETYLRLREEEERRREHAARVEQGLLVFRAAQAQRDLASARRRLERARVLAASLAEPRANDDALADEVVVETEQRLAAARRRADDLAGGGHGLAVLVAATALLAGGLVALAFGQLTAGLVLLILGLGGLAWSLARRGSPAQAEAVKEVQRLAEAVARQARERSERAAAAAKAEAERSELAALLGGGSLESLAEDADRREGALRRMEVQVDVGMAAAVALDEDVDARLEQLEAEARQARQAWATASGQAAQQQASTAGVAEAEETLAAAQADLEALRALNRTLDLTRAFLERAQERAHRGVAPVLAESVRAWLPRVTAGRYVDARVDPLTLRVVVQGQDSRWSEAPLLSHGTAEQVYLLLRVAMARHLTRKGEVCPLILDDVTVHCDADRERAVLATLRELSGERQVILFSQEQAVLDWAERTLAPPRDAIVRLSVR